MLEALDHVLAWRNEPIHRWFFITEGLPVGLVRNFLKSAKGEIFDGFLGCGTVPLEAMRLGLNTVGTDVNPFMIFASSVKTHYHHIDKRTLKGFVADLFPELSQSYDNGVPSILENYFSPTMMRKISVLKDAIFDLKDSWAKKALKLALAKLSLRVGNVKMSPAPRFHTRKTHRSPNRLFREIVSQIIEDIPNDDPVGTVTILRRDSRLMELSRDYKFSLALSSPPYCNNVDFVRHTQIPSYWLGFCHSAKDLRRIRRSSVTSCEAMAYKEKDDAQTKDRDVASLVKHLRKRSHRRFHSVVSQYFSGMESHFLSLAEHMKKNGRIVYVVGDSWIQGVHIPTQRILAKFVRRAGFHSVRIDWLRYRKSGRQHSRTLSEYLLMAEW